MNTFLTTCLHHDYISIIMITFLTTCVHFFLQPGKLKHVQAIGWYLEEANMAQVSVNITDYEETSIHAVYEEVCKDAEVSSKSVH